MKLNPCLLLISFENEIVLELCFYEAGMVVCRRIDEVPDDFFGAPLVWLG